MASDLDALMEDASRALVEMRYLDAEAMCVRALGMARERGDWSYYGRILMPLQECRRQRRMIALDASVQLGTTDGYAVPERGCLVLTRPCNFEDANALWRQAIEQQLYLKVLVCDSDAGDPLWTLTTYRGPALRCTVEAPRDLPHDVPLDPEEHPRAAEWFTEAFEALGDDALAAVFEPPGSIERVNKLEQMVTAVGDHELLHQALGAAARAMRDAP